MQDPAVVPLKMRWTFLALFASTVIALGGESLELRLSKRTLPLATAREGETLSEVLNSLRRGYRARYRESLPIFIAVELAGPARPGAIKALPAVPKIPGLVPAEASDDCPGTARTGDTLDEVPVNELLRYVSSLSGVAFTIRDDVVLIHAAAR